MMSCGYFGKLEQRADFVSQNLPPGFGRMWEGFLEEGLAQSRRDLQEEWEDAYLTMPVWRYLLMPADHGFPLPDPIAGVFMPSIDKVGRCYPLTIVGTLPEKAESQSPDTVWYDDAGRVLLTALDEISTFEAFHEAVSALDAPRWSSDAFSPAAEEHSDCVTELLEPSADYQDRLSSRFWCRMGETEICLTSNGMPAADEFRHFLLPERLSVPGLRNKAAAQSGLTDDRKEHKS